VTIEQWIAQALTDPDKGKACTALSLVYVKTTGVGQEEVHTKNLQGATHNARELADLFISRATGFAQDLPGLQNFRLLAFYGSPEPQAAFPFTVADGDLTAGEVPYSRHEPTNTGQLAQLMKHNEALMSMLMQVVQTIAVQSVQREEQLRRDVRDADMIVRDVIMNMHKQNHEARMAELAFARTTEERRMLAKVMPSLANYLAGREVIPEAVGDSALIDALAAKVKPQHIQMLIGAGIIDEQTAAVLVARFNRALEERKKEQEALQRIPPEEPMALNGEAPASLDA